MICSGCGKNIPFSGEVCPFCQRQKGDDQAQQALGCFGIGIGIIVALVLIGVMSLIAGQLIFWPGAIIGSIGGAILAVFLVMQANSTKLKESQQHIVTTRTGISSPPPPPKRTEQIYLLRGETQHGPYTLDDLSVWLADGTVTAEDLVWKEGLAEWVTIHRLLHG